MRESTMGRAKRRAVLRLEVLEDRRLLSANPLVAQLPPEPVEYEAREEVVSDVLEVVEEVAEDVPLDDYGYVCDIMPEDGGDVVLTDETWVDDPEAYLFEVVDEPIDPDVIFWSFADGDTDPGTVVTTDDPILKPVEYVIDDVVFPDGDMIAPGNDDLVYFPVPATDKTDVAFDADYYTLSAAVGEYATASTLDAQDDLPVLDDAPLLAAMSTSPVSVAAPAPVSPPPATPVVNDQSPLAIALGSDEEPTATQEASTPAEDEAAPILATDSTGTSPSGDDDAVVEAPAASSTSESANEELTDDLVVPVDLPY